MATKKETTKPKAQQKTAGSGQTEKPEKKYDTPRLLRGMKDILMGEEPFWNTLFDSAQNLATSYGFGYIRMPVPEQTKLFVRSVGKNTDIVEKEMYTFEDLDGTKISLRPEATASTVRAYILHGMLNQPQPVKMWYSGPMFRHERPQAGRYRQFHQIGFEVIGSDDAAVDAMLITIAYKMLQDIGIESLVHVNSIGCKDCREPYIMELQAHYKSNRSKLCDNCKKRVTRNPMRVLDCKEEGCQEVKESSPQIVDKLCEPCKKHFMQVLEFCDELEIPYFLNPYLVRGLDYYSRTVFELLAPDEVGEDGEPKRSQSSFGAGGRYDYLVEHLGGRPTPAAGFAHGIERIVSHLHRMNLPAARQKRPQIFVAHLGELGRRKAFVLFEQLRKEGLRVRECFAKSGLRDQLQVADKVKAPFAFIVGQREVLEGTVIIRDMDSGIQEIIDMKKAIPTLLKQLQAKEEESGSLEFMPEVKAKEESEEGDSEDDIDIDNKDEDDTIDES